MVLQFHFVITTIIGTSHDIYGYDLDYPTLLRMANIPTLEDRRVEAFNKFTYKTLKNPKYAHWFPRNIPERMTRNTATYKEETSLGNILYNSPIFSMRRLLNRSKNIEQVDLTGFFNAP